MESSVWGHVHRPIICVVDTCVDNCEAVLLDAGGWVHGHSAGLTDLSQGLRVQTHVLEYDADMKMVNDEGLYLL